MNKTEQAFVTAVTCMDGRIQEPVSAYLKETFHVSYVDTITEPGPDRILAELVDYEIVKSIRRRLDISVDKHGSKIIAVIGHHDCAGNPVDRDTHHSHIRTYTYHH